MKYDGEAVNTQQLIMYFLRIKKLLNYLNTEGAETRTIVFRGKETIHVSLHHFRLIILRLISYAAKIRIYALLPSIRIHQTTVALG